MLSWAERLQLSSGGCYFGSTGWRREPRGSGVVQLQAWLCSPVFRHRRGYCSGAKEAHVMSTLSKLLSPGMVVCDVGSHLAATTPLPCLTWSVGQAVFSPSSPCPSMSYRCEKPCS